MGIPLRDYPTEEVHETTTDLHGVINDPGDREETHQVNMQKFKLLLIAAAGLLFAVTAQAQYSLQTTSPYNGTTGNFASASTNSSLTAPQLSFTRATYGAVQVGFKLDGAGTSAVVFKFDESIDGSNWVPTTRTLSVTADGTTTVHNLSNLTLGGAGYLRLSYIGNPNSANITNLYVKFAYKPGI